MVLNLTFLGKIIVFKVVFTQITGFLSLNCCLDKFQSGFWPNHRTEMALIKVINDIRLNADFGKTSGLLLLELPLILLTIKFS